MLKTFCVRKFINNSSIFRFFHKQKFVLMWQMYGLRFMLTIASLSALLALRVWFARAVKVYSFVMQSLWTLFFLW